MNSVSEQCVYARTLPIHDSISEQCAYTHTLPIHVKPTSVLSRCPDRRPHHPTLTSPLVLRREGCKELECMHLYVCVYSRYARTPHSVSHIHTEDTGTFIHTHVYVYTYLKTEMCLMAFLHRKQHRYMVTWHDNTELYVQYICKYVQYKQEWHTQCGHNIHK